MLGKVGVLFTDEPGKYTFGAKGMEVLSIVPNPRQEGEFVITYRVPDGGMDLEQVFEAVRREEAYARGWGDPKQRPDGKKDHYTDLKTGLPYRPMDWIAFAEKYIQDAKLAWANYTPDERGVTVRMLKAAYLLLAGVAVSHTPDEIETLGGYSSNRYPIHHGGLQAMKESIEREKA